eukprot:Skav227270  [mRNA]  locus=scaffold3803:38675:61201:- [translate_table: standard]
MGPRSAGSHPVLPGVKGGKKAPRYLLDRNEVGETKSLEEAQRKMLEEKKPSILQEWHGLTVGLRWIVPQDEDYYRRPDWGFIQRLDLETDGPVITAKTWRAQRMLQAGPVLAADPRVSMRDYLADPTIHLIWILNPKLLDARLAAIQKSRPSWDRPPTEEEGDKASEEQIKSLFDALVQDAKLGRGTGSRWRYTLKGKERLKARMKSKETKERQKRQRDQPDPPPEEPDYKRQRPRPTPDLPEGWEQRMSSQHGKFYYINTRTQETTWTPPPRVANGVQGQIAEILSQCPSAVASLDVFYEQGAMDDILSPLREKLPKANTPPQVCFAQQLVCEIVAFAVVKHGYRAKVYVIRHGLGQQVCRLLSAPQKYLQLAAVRVLRAIIGTKEATAAIRLAKGGGTNLMASATLELLEFIRQQNLKVENICKNHGQKTQFEAALGQKPGSHQRARARSLLKAYSDQMKPLEQLLLKYQQNLEVEKYPPEQFSGGRPVDGHLAHHLRIQGMMSSALKAMEGEGCKGRCCWQVAEVPAPWHRHGGLELTCDATATAMESTCERERQRLRQQQQPS